MHGLEAQPSSGGNAAPQPGQRAQAGSTAHRARQTERPEAGRAGDREGCALDRDLCEELETRRRGGAVNGHGGQRHEGMKGHPEALGEGREQAARAGEDAGKWQRQLSKAKVAVAAQTPG